MALRVEDTGAAPKRTRVSRPTKLKSATVETPTPEITPAAEQVAPAKPARASTRRSTTTATKSPKVVPIRPDAAEKPVAKTSRRKPAPSVDARSKLAEAFRSMDLSEEVERAIAEMGYVDPTEIQVRAIPLLLEGEDIIGQAQTGTGKTAAFGIPLVEGIQEERRYPQALVLAPTRELALQISEELRKISKYVPGVDVVTLYGGAGYGRQFEDLKDGAQIVVGTPGRVIDHLQRGTLKLDTIDYLVLDEADRMLDMGFLPDVERILRRTPRNRQTALFSATVSTVIKILSRRYMHNPTHVAVQPQQKTVTDVDQRYYEVADRDKVDGLLSLIEIDPPERAMIFRRTKLGVDKLFSALRRHGVKVDAIHGDMSQRVREKVLAEFRDGTLQFLIATDVASRGLDIPEVSHVYNFDIPEDSESYVHRIGRTARAGRKGTAVTFVGEWDLDKLPVIQKVVGDRLQRHILPLYQRT